MHIKISQITKPLIIYAAQEAALWGLFDGYNYFNGDALKKALGSYWFIIYILPLFTTAYVIFRDLKKESTRQETIKTQGDFSPGKVEQDYSVGGIQKIMPNSNSSPQQNKKPNESLEQETITTEGNYSPGKVGGSYSVQNPVETSKQDKTTSGENQAPEPNQPAPKPAKTIHTKGNYSPGEVGGDYKIER